MCITIDNKYYAQYYFIIGDVTIVYDETEVRLPVLIIRLHLFSYDKVMNNIPSVDNCVRWHGNGTGIIQVSSL